jgi:hypothetical protein
LIQGAKRAKKPWEIDQTSSMDRPSIKIDSSIRCLQDFIALWNHYENAKGKEQGTKSIVETPDLF